MNIAIVLSGGRGSRLGLETPKQYIRVNEKMIINYSLDELLRHEYIHGVVIVAENEFRDMLYTEINIKDKFMGFADPGENRQLSIYNALKLIDEMKTDCTNVFVHDAARPNLTADMITKYLDAMNGYDGVMPVLPMKDTVYISSDGASITSLIDRKTVYAGQAPEVFDFKKYLAANISLMPDNIKSINGSSEPAVMAGMKIAMVKGDENNYKITTKTDLEKFSSCMHRF